MEQFWNENPPQMIDTKSVVKEEMGKIIESGSDGEKVAKIISLQATYLALSSRGMTEDLFPDWFCSIADVFGLPLNDENGHMAALEIMRETVYEYMKKYGYLFFGMQEWNYLIARFELDKENGREAIGIVTESGLTIDPFAECIPEEIRMNPDIAETIEDQCEQVITALLEGVVGDRIAQALYKSIPRIVNHLYADDYSRALEDIQKNKEKSLFITRYSRYMLKLVGDLNASSGDFFPMEDIEDTREEILSVAASNANCIFTKNEERSIENMLKRAHEKSREVYIKTLLKMIELHLMEKLIGIGEDEI